MISNNLVWGHHKVFRPLYLGVSIVKSILDCSLRSVLLGCKLKTIFGKKYFFKMLLLVLMIKIPISVYFDVYGCQMNVNDTEIAWSILQEKNYHRTTDISEVFITFTSLCNMHQILKAVKMIFFR